MSPSSPAARPAPNPTSSPSTPSAPTAPPPVAWCAVTPAQAAKGLPTVRHLMRAGHPVTLITPAWVWRAVRGGSPKHREHAAPKELIKELDAAGIQVHHPRALRQAEVETPLDARGLLHAVNLTEGDQSFQDRLARDPELTDLLRTAVVLWPGSSRTIPLDHGEVLTGAPARREIRSMLDDAIEDKRLRARQVLDLADQLPDLVSPRRVALAASSVVRAGNWTRGEDALLETLQELARTATSRADAAALTGLTFHRALHADAVHSPLVERPDAWLAPLRSTQRWQRLAVEGTRPATSPVPSSDHPHVVLLPGTYGRFEQPVVQALEAAGCTVDVLDLSDAFPGRLKRVPDEDNLTAVTALVEKGVHHLPAEVRDRLAAADVVWADWADLPAVWASHLVTPQQRLVLRVHSLDALDPWLHAVRWSAVDALVAVGAPVARVALAALGPRLDLPPVHVIGHVVGDHWSEVPTTDDAHRRLVMVKWGRQVKDPLRALEILARLREHDPAWRLRLIGSDLADAGEPGPYAKQFVRRVQEPDVADALEFVPQTDDVAHHLAGCGFVLSTSRRESFHLGLVEAAAAGCVPVVRDWPVYARRGGARDVVPPEWVPQEEGDGIDAAVERILGLSGREDWEQASRRTRHQVREHFPTEKLSARVVAAALGREQAGS